MTPLTSVLEAMQARQLDRARVLPATERAAMSGAKGVGGGIKGGGGSEVSAVLQRARHGLGARMMRESLYAFGLNQLADFFEERWAPSVLDAQPVARCAVGSLFAGVVA